MGQRLNHEGSGRVLFLQWWLVVLQDLHFFRRQEAPERHQQCRDRLLSC